MDTKHSDSPPDVSQRPDSPPQPNEPQQSEPAPPSSQQESEPEQASAPQASEPEQASSQQESETSLAGEAAAVLAPTLRRWPWLLAGLAAGAVGITVVRQVPAVNRFFRTPGWRWVIATTLAEGVLRVLLALQRILIGRAPELARPIRKPTRPWRPSRAA